MSETTDERHYCTDYELCGVCGLCTGCCDSDEELHCDAEDTCRVCNDTGIVWSPDPDRESLYESACPEPGCTTPYPVAADLTDTGEAPF